LVPIQSKLTLAESSVAQGALIQDAWESHFREKSRRRSSLRAKVTLRSVAGWSLAAIALFAFVVALLETIQV